MGKFILFLRVLIAAAVILLSVFFALLPACILWVVHLRKASDFWLALTSKYTCRLLLFCAGAKIEDLTETHFDKKTIGKHVYVSNHQSMVDVLTIISRGHSAGFIAKSELKKMPVINLWIKALHGVFMHRQSLRDAATAIRKGIDRVNAGYTMMVFPEGTRSKDGNIAPFKHGSFKLVTRTGATVIPIVIKGSRDVLENRKKFGHVTVKYKELAPIELKDLSYDERFDIINTVENLIREEYAKM